MALVTDSVSSARVFWRFSHSLAFAPHFSLTSLANAISSPMEARASLMFCFSCIRSSSAAAFCSFLEAIWTLAASDSARLAAISFSYSALLVFSASCSSFKLLSKSAFKPLRTPSTLPVLGSCNNMLRRRPFSELKSPACLARIFCKVCEMAVCCESCTKDAPLAMVSPADFTLLRLFSRSISSSWNLASCFFRRAMVSSMEASFFSTSFPRFLYSTASRALLADS
mmetsp:Transcript_31057/g.38138  ORF Transcript_31057/g.38138 Transcript_31057/m.38138 type:complete len:226 (-) Transcript_31057:36-713(-)